MLVYWDSETLPISTATRQMGEFKDTEAEEIERESNSWVFVPCALDYYNLPIGLKFVNI
jgi:Fe-S oxidoreductase